MKPSIVVLSMMYAATEEAAGKLETKITADMARAATGDREAGARAEANLGLLEQKIAELGGIERMMIEAPTPRPEAP
jgi:hypothetical protein